VVDPSYDFFGTPTLLPPVEPAPAATPIPIPIPVPVPVALAPRVTPGLAPPVPPTPRFTEERRAVPRLIAPAEAAAEETQQARSEPGDGQTEDVGALGRWLAELVERKGSDLHLTVGAPPSIRVDGHVEPIDGEPKLEPRQLQQILYAIINQQQRQRFEETLELDFAYAVFGLARFRINLYMQRQSLGAVMRVIPFGIKPLEDLGVPAQVAAFAHLRRGFVLVTGPTGSGKSTTMAAILDLANRSRKDHIVTVEDPIEFLHQHKSCLVNQREVGEDTHSFSAALKHVLRQDPDIIMVGEMRDLETISVALTAAETGHLVFATLHTQDAAQTIDRVVDVFPPHQQQQIRVQLASALQGVVCQTLVRRADGNGRAVATEVLVATAAIRNLVREGKTHQIASAMQAGARHGMHTMDQHLAELVKSGVVTYETALDKCNHVEEFTRLAGRA